MPESAYHEIEHEFITGDLPEAQQSASDALSRFGDDPKWAEVFRVALARVRLYQGHGADVVTILEQKPPAAISDDLLIRRNLLLAIAQAHLGHAALARQELARAKTLHPQAEAHVEMLAAEGSVALYQGHFDEAEQCFQTALTEAQQLHSNFLAMQMWMNRGAVAIEVEHYEQAVTFFQNGTMIAQSIGARLAIEKALSNMSAMYLHTGDFVRAIQTGNEAVTQAKALGVTIDEVQLLLNVGTSQLQMSDLDGARSSVEKALALAEDLQNPEKMLNCQIALAYILLAQRPEAAESHITEAVRIAQLTQDPTEQVEPALLSSMLLIKQGHDEAAEIKLQQLVKATMSFPSVQWAAESTLATLYADANRTQDADCWFQRAISTFHHQRLSLKSVELELPFLENGSDLYLGYMEHLIHTGRTKLALQVLDQSRAETLAEGLGVTDRHASGFPTSARALAARLHGTVLIYCLRPKASYLWAANGSQEQFYTLAGNSALLPLIKLHTAAILASKDLLSQADAPGRALYDGLVKPAEPLIKTGGRVYIIGDRELNGLNFETLIRDGGHPHYWIEDAVITNARSLRMLTASRELPATHRKEEMLLIGDPIYRKDEYAALPNASVEMSRVASHFPVERRSVVSGAQAAPSRYTVSGPGRFAYIHFVAHATANETSPLDSAIILSGSPDTSKLYARDILKEPLTADLVTLSSCYGSGVRNYSGEGVVGLVWAFLRAGAHSVIGAMWEVSDVSTPQLMDALYTKLLAGERPDAALQAAKLSLLHSDGVFRKPLYWASFQLYAGR